MDVNEKYKNHIKIKDGEILHISRNLDVVFYKEPQKESYYGYVDKQIESAEESGNSTLILGMSTKVNSPEEIAEWIVDAVKYNPLDLKSFFITIVYNGKGEKENIMSSIIKGLGLNENEVFKNLKR
jgi:hypothetical protein